MEETKVGRWRGFLDSLSTTGGHIFVLCYFAMFGTVVLAIGEWRGSMKLAEVGAGMEGLALGALLMMYKSSGTNIEQVARAGAPFTPPTQVTLPPATSATTTVTTETTTTEQQKEQTQ